MQEGKSMEWFEYGSPDARIVLLQPVGEHDLGAAEREFAIIQESAAVEFRLAAFRVGDWNAELSPWKAPAVFGQEDFGGGAEETLGRVLEFCVDRTKTYLLGGYSLAGLFALWAACRTDLFRGVAAASPSVWFPGFAEYMRENRMRSRHVYLSLGDKEEKARNPVLATVGDEIRSAYELLSRQGVDCVLEWNKGNHFRDADLRTAGAFSWVLNRMDESGRRD